MDIVVYLLACFALNLPFGAYRARTARFSPAWFLAIHLPIPAIFVLRLGLGVSPWFIPAGIAFAVAGQVIGAGTLAPSSWRQIGQAKDVAKHPEPAADGAA